MSFSLIPNYKFKTLTEITAGFLNDRGIKLLMLDLDNTIAPYKDEQPSDEILLWVHGLQVSGIQLYIVSNSRKKWRVSAFSEALGIPFINNAGKPSPRAIKKLLETLSVPASSAALAGDQIYTDVLAANSAAVSSIVVNPIRFTNIFLAIRYSLELPFRALRRTE